MMNQMNKQPAGRGKCAGAAVVEFALVLPLLILLALPIFDFARAIQANMIVVNMSREGASLASRANLTYSDQQIMGALASTAPPLDMSNSGMIYITRVMGHAEAGGIRNVVLDQYRWAQGWNQSHYSPPSAVWNCGTSGTSWATGGSCRNIPTGNSAPTANVMTGQLSDGEVIYAVDVFYGFNTLFGGMNLGFGLTTPQLSHDLHAMTVL